MCKEKYQNLFKVQEELEMKDKHTDESFKASKYVTGILEPHTGLC